MRVILSILVWLVVALMSLLVCLVSVICAVTLFPFDRHRKFAHSLGYWWAEVIFAVNPFWSLHISGLQHFNPQKTYIITANHQSMFDIVLLYKMHRQFKWVAKENLFSIPIFGWAMSLAKHIRLTRGKHGSIKEAYDQAAGFLRQGISVLFFPEGTRSLTNELNPFKNGAFKLAIEEKKPVLPVCLNGTRDIVRKGGFFVNVKASCTLKVLPAIETKDLLPEDFATLRDSVRNKLAENLTA